MVLDFVIAPLPFGFYGGFLGGVLGVLVTYQRSEMLTQWARMLAEIVIAVIFSGAVVETYLPVNNFLSCAGVCVFIGSATGIALDLWRKIAPEFLSNLFNRASKMMTGEELKSKRKGKKDNENQ